MMKSKIFFLLLILSLNISLGASNCDGYLWKAKPSQVRVPFGESKTSEDILKFGFESEYTMDRIDRIVEHFRPDDILLEKDAWNALNNKSKVQWVIKNKEKLFPKMRTQGNFILDTKDPLLNEFMPKRLIMDETGNIEIVLDPVDSLEAWYRNVTYINHTFGAGSMQATVGLKKSSFFLKNINQEKQESLNKILGYFNFVNLYDVLDKLESGYARYLKDKTKLVAQSFNHPYLGPMTKAKQKELKSLLNKNFEDQMYSKSAMGNISEQEGSFKYIGSTTYRPDIAYKKDIIILEARDAHSNLTTLSERLNRNTQFLISNRDGYKNASDLNIFDSVKDFEKLSIKTRNFLKQIFPEKVNPIGDVSYYKEANNQLGIEVYRNFSFPMQDWNSLIEFLQSDKLVLKIKKAQDNYSNTLELLADRLARGDLDIPNAQKQVQAQLTKFAKESGVLTELKNWQKKNHLIKPKSSESELLYFYHL